MKAAAKRTSTKNLAPHDLRRTCARLCLGFFRDGKRIWFTGAEASQPDRTYMQEISGGAPRPVTPEGVFAVSVSPDGKFMLAPGPDGHLALFPVDGGTRWISPAAKSRWCFN